MGKGGLDRYPLAGQDVSAELHLPQALGFVVCFSEFDWVLRLGIKGSRARSGTDTKLD